MLDVEMRKRDEIESLASVICYQKKQAMGCVDSNCKLNDASTPCRIRQSLLCFTQTTSRRRPLLLRRPVIQRFTIAWLMLWSGISYATESDGDIPNNRTESESIDETDQAAWLHMDTFEDSFLDPLASDPSCSGPNEDCFSPPDSTVEEIEIETVVTTTSKLDATCFKGGDDIPEDEEGENDPDSFDIAITQPDGKCLPKQQKTTQQTKTIRVDKHWGNDTAILNMRDQLLNQSLDSLNDSRPPIFLLPGLASTRLVAWRVKKCASAFSKEIKVQENVWLNMNLVIRMGTMDVDCMKQCLELGRNQTDTDDWEKGCKLRPDEGLDSIASLSPAGLGAELLVGGTNTVYAWLVQWLADNLGYDVTTIVGLGYDWRLSPDKMEARDGFLQSFRRRIEAAVATQGQPGIMVAHSMGNLVFRYFLEWLRVEMRQDVFKESLKRQRRRAERWKRQRIKQIQLQRPLTSHTNDGTEVQSGTGGWVSFVHNGDVAENNGEQNEAIKANDDPPNEVLESQLWELAKYEGDEKFLEWLETHVWTYVGLSSPLLGAVNPLRAVISGENMGLPIHDRVAREMELTFGSTHTLNPVSTSNGFCDSWETDNWDEDPRKHEHGGTLACLDDIMNDIELHSEGDAWKNHSALKALMRDRIDWDTGKPMIAIELEKCFPPKEDAKRSKVICQIADRIAIRPKHVEDASMFDTFGEHWKEEGEPLQIKKEQLVQSYQNSSVLNILNHTWERPLIKHIIIAYGVDVPTEVGYLYKKDVDKNETGIPHLSTVIWENPGGKLTMEAMDPPRGGIADVFVKKPRQKQLNVTVPEARLQHCGDGSVPYLSLAWAHTWLLHAARARKYTEEKHSGAVSRVDTKKNALDYIQLSHRPRGELDWVEGPAPQDEVPDDNDPTTDGDTGTTHPHGTRYKPLMKKFHNVGISRTTGIEYTTSVIEAIGVEHKETTRNYDILAAVFSDIVKYMHDDLGLITKEENGVPAGTEENNDDNIEDPKLLFS